MSLFNVEPLSDVQWRIIVDENDFSYGLDILFNTMMNYIPADTRRNNVIMVSKGRHDVVLTS